MAGINGAWQSIRAKAGLHDVGIHDIRHSLASRALGLGEGLPIIGRLTDTYTSNVKRVKRSAACGRTPTTSIPEPTGTGSECAVIWRRPFLPS